MKKLIVIFFLLPWAVISAQEVDWKNFNLTRLNAVIFSEMQEFSKIEGVDTLLHTSIGGQRIYRYIKRNHSRVRFNDININLDGILREYDSEITKRTGSIGSLGLLDSFSIKGISSLKEVADKCITDWKNSPSDYFFMGWSQLVEVITYYDRETKVIYVFFAYLR